jgi:hypothetical protein
MSQDNPDEEGTVALYVLDHEGPSPRQWAMVIRGMRNAHESWEQGDSVLPYGDGGQTPFILGPKDAALALRLARAGTDHGKYLRQLPIHLEVCAEYWWREFDTYRAGLVQEAPDQVEVIQATDITENSTSQMHTLGKEPVTATLLSIEDMEQADRDVLLGLVNRLRDRWVEAGKKKPSREWRAMIQALAQSWNYTRTISLNYQVARSMYRARLGHRLTEWQRLRGELELLPNSQLITG